VIALTNPRKPADQPSTIPVYHMTQDTCYDHVLQYLSLFNLDNRGRYIW